MAGNGEITARPVSLPMTWRLGKHLRGNGGPHATHIFTDWSNPIVERTRTENSASVSLSIPGKITELTVRTQDVVYLTQEGLHMKSRKAQDHFGLIIAARAGNQEAIDKLREIEVNLETAEITQLSDLGEVVEVNIEGKPYEAVLGLIGSPAVRRILDKAIGTDNYDINARGYVVGISQQEQEEGTPRIELANAAVDAINEETGLGVTIPDFATIDSVVKELGESSLSGKDLIYVHVRDKKDDELMTGVCYYTRYIQTAVPKNDIPNHIGFLLVRPKE